MACTKKPWISLSVTPCLVLPLMLHLSQGHSKGQECDPPQISQGSNELHIVLRLGTPQVQLGFTGSPASSSSAGLSSYHDIGTTKTSWFHLKHSFII